MDGLVVFQRRKEERERDNRYSGVMRSLVWRYVSAMHRREEESAVTEDDVNEVKMEISSMRYEILEIFEKNGMDISGAEKKEKTVLAKKMKVWERRLMKDFHVAGVQEEEGNDEDVEEPAANETGLSRFKRAAMKVATNSASSKWGQVISDVGVVTNSQIGRCRNRQSFKNQQNLQRAMDEARRLVARSPMERSGTASPIDVAEDDTLMKLLKNIAEELQEVSPGQTLCVDKKAKKGHSRSTTPVTTQLLQDILGNRSPNPTVVQARTPEMRRSPLPAVSKESLSKSAAAPVKSPSPAKAKRPDTPKTAGITSPPPLIQITQHEAMCEEPEDVIEPAKSPPPPPSREPDNNSCNKKSLPKKRPAPTPDSAAVSRPVPQKPPVNHQGMIPPPPSRKDEPAPESITVSAGKPHPPDSIITIPKCESPLPTIVSITQKDDNMTITMESGSGSSSAGSRENLVPTSPTPSGGAGLGGAASRTTPSPACLRPVRRVEDVTTIKRQPKTGWL